MQVIERRSRTSLVIPRPNRFGDRAESKTVYNDWPCEQAGLQGLTMRLSYLAVDWTTSPYFIVMLADDAGVFVANGFGSNISEALEDMFGSTPGVDLSAFLADAPIENMEDTDGGHPDTGLDPEPQPARSVVPDAVVPNN